jgi:hypothetical protein
VEAAVVAVAVAVAVADGLTAVVGDAEGLAEGISVGRSDANVLAGAVVAGLHPASSKASTSVTSATKAKILFIAPHLSQFGTHSISRYLTNIRELLVFYFWDNHPVPDLQQGIVMEKITIRKNRPSGRLFGNRIV